MISLFLLLRSIIATARAYTFTICVLESVIALYTRLLDCRLITPLYLTCGLAGLCPSYPPKPFALSLTHTFNHPGFYISSFKCCRFCVVIEMTMISCSFSSRM
eukprot:Gregarina_sp_Pseudo_9__3906@NODE_404_length_2913_cov_11_154836_g381_i0_p4_GENE_NODE_404_length_2913_cov_11_154836_g381_i0NODE_404_length_2913_cov_11_154836_g381_i0_p4_ORF_typecomplete_len103_score21_76CDK5_activator/PF03261_15/0_043_NODE_404_length_2913_cov_11_154836_g381_i024782786